MVSRCAGGQHRLCCFCCPVRHGVLGRFQPEAVEWADYAYLTLNRGTTSVVFVPATPTSHRTLRGLLPLLVTLGWACNHSTRRNAILPFPDALSWQCPT